MQPSFSLWDSKVVSYDVSKLLALAEQQERAKEQLVCGPSVWPEPLLPPRHLWPDLPLEPLHMPGTAPAPQPPAPVPVPTGSEGPHPAPASLRIRCGARGTTYQPSRRKRVNRHGIEKRLSTPQGRELLLRRLKKGRWRVTVDAFR
ncbi:hypothetical protein HYH03_010519 [Edaphochlamys debaryana]|uniref:Large ribosomal subunit protein bL34m n=1 Tax=Edaphochlamys debaryana TaxID=47281 RepID=A0A835Y4V8_9CHLO|nr:hypothetical protein HYH03_010519 [Edaphochlamys debaryana]|eukprot:KAG2491074.1 hypothetical protein HYH03_010519 [Edaphochlamys debaryana]